MNNCLDCSKGQCPWFCPIHLIHHPVQDMVTFCVDKATKPQSA
jgi:hypothetical protein